MSLLRINTRPSGRQLAVFAAAWALFAAGAGLHFWRHGSPGAAATAWGAGIALPLAGALSRSILRAAFVGLSYATYPVGWVVSHLAVALVYFVAITPAGVIMRAVGYDPLHRSIDREAPSYWVQRPRSPKASEYFKQG